MKYAGEFRIGKVEASVKKVNIDSYYSSISIAFVPAPNFLVDARGSYLSFNDDKERLSLSSSETSD
jgi:hypothetical protein